MILSDTQAAVRDAVRDFAPDRIATVAKVYRDVRVCQVYESTSDIQRMVIAPLAVNSPTASWKEPGP